VCVIVIGPGREVGLPGRRRSDLVGVSVLHGSVSLKLPSEAGLRHLDRSAQEVRDPGQCGV